MQGCFLYIRAFKTRFVAMEFARVYAQRVAYPQLRRVLTAASRSHSCIAYLADASAYASVFGLCIARLACRLLLRRGAGNEIQHCLDILIFNQPRVNLQGFA